MAFEKLPVGIEMKIVAMIARGDRYESIRTAIKDEFEREVSIGVLTSIKKRNSEALTAIKDAITQKERDDARGLLERSHRLIGKQLRAAEEGDIPEIKTSDLVAISKEMFHQTRTEQSPDDPAKLANPKEKLKELQALLDENDEVRLERIIFAKREQTSEIRDTSIPNGGGDGGEHGSRLQGEDIPAGDHPDRQEAQVYAPPETP